MFQRPLLKVTGANFSTDNNKSNLFMKAHVISDSDLITSYVTVHTFHTKQLTVSLLSDVAGPVTLARYYFYIKPVSIWYCLLQQQYRRRVIVEFKKKREKGDWKIIRKSTFHFSFFYVKTKSVREH